VAGSETAQIDRGVIQLFALVSEAIAGATDALLTGDREAAKRLVARDALVDDLYREVEVLAEDLLAGDAVPEAHRRRGLIAIFRMLPELERSGDLAEHIARRATRGVATEVSARGRGLLGRMGEVSCEMWRMAADAYGEGTAGAASRIDELDDELDELHVAFTAELLSSGTPLAVAIELAHVGRFYERLGDHAVNLTRRMPVRSPVLRSTGATSQASA
jgi:phosphate transport system protein